MRIRHTILLGASLLAAGCGSSPLAPDSSVLSAGRRVGTLSGGEGQGPCTPQGLIVGSLTFATATDTYQSNFRTCQTVPGSQTFGFLTLALSGTGRFRYVEIVFGGFKPERAEFFVTLIPEEAPVAFQDAGAGTPTFSVASDSSCASGQRLNASVTIHLENVGPVEISTQHCVPAQ